MVLYWGGIVLNRVVISKLKIELLIWPNLCSSYDFLLVGTTMVLTKNSPKARVGIESSQLLPINPDFRAPFCSVDPLDVSIVKSCEQCGRQFRSTQGYRRHIQMYHSDRQFPQCKLCGKHFASPHNLKIHHASHTNLRPFKCEICQNTYKLKHHLKDHKCIGKTKPPQEN